NPGTGRFLTPDPYRNSAGLANPGSWNRYTYVISDPVNLIDPQGLEFVLPTCDGSDADCGGDFDPNSVFWVNGGNDTNDGQPVGYDASGNPIFSATGHHPAAVR